MNCHLSAAGKLFRIVTLKLTGWQWAQARTEMHVFIKGGLPVIVLTALNANHGWSHVTHQLYT